jgi:pimeloyl-ACP methyl ester carboxylesterase
MHEHSIWNDLLGARVGFRGRAFRTRTIEFGGGAPKTLVLLHGLGGHAEAYSRNLRRLGADYHAIAVDLLWHGLTAGPEPIERIVPAFARQYIDLLDDLGIERASIEGESLGGWTAMWIALNHPDRVDKIILNTAAGVRWNRDAVAIDDVAGTNELRDRSMAAVADPSAATIRKRLEWLMATPDRVTDELVDLRRALYTNPRTNTALRRVFHERFADKRDMIDEPALAGIAADTLVLWSDKNPGAGDDAGRRLSELIPGSTYHCIADAAHWPQWEQPEEHDRVVLAHLARHDTIMHV